MKCVKWRESSTCYTTRCSSGASACATHEGNAIIYVGELFPSENSKENMSEGEYVERKTWRTRGREIKREIRRDATAGKIENCALRWRLKSDWSVCHTTRGKACRLKVSARIWRSFYSSLVNPSNIFTSECSVYENWTLCTLHVRLATITLDAFAYFVKYSMN